MLHMNSELVVRDQPQSTALVTQPSRRSNGVKRSQQREMEMSANFFSDPNACTPKVLNSEPSVKSFAQTYRRSK